MKHTAVACSSCKYPTSVVLMEDSKYVECQNPDCALFGQKILVDTCPECRGILPQHKLSCSQREGKGLRVKMDYCEEFRDECSTCGRAICTKTDPVVVQAPGLLRCSSCENKRLRAKLQEAETKLQKIAGALGNVARSSKQGLVDEPAEKDGKFFLVFHIYAFGKGDERVVSVRGKDAYESLGDVLDGVLEEAFYDLPVPEVKWAVRDFAGLEHPIWKPLKDLALRTPHLFVSPK